MHWVISLNNVNVLSLPCSTWLVYGLTFKSALQIKECIDAWLVPNKLSDSLMNCETARAELLHTSHRNGKPAKNRLCVSVCVCVCVVHSVCFCVSVVHGVCFRVCLCVWCMVFLVWYRVRVCVCTHLYSMAYSLSIFRGNHSRQLTQWIWMTLVENTGLLGRPGLGTEPLHSLGIYSSPGVSAMKKFVK